MLNFYISFDFWFFNNLFLFFLFLCWRPIWNRGNFENFKNKEHNFEWWSICVKFQKDPLYGVNLTCFPPWLTWQRPQFRICSTPQKLPHTTMHIPTMFHEVWWKESKHFLNPPFLFPCQLRQSLSNQFPFTSLSRSTCCGCCSYQVSSISVWWVTCYDHFCVFQFFSILDVSMATAAILKKLTLKSTTSHVIWYSYKVS